MNNLKQLALTALNNFFANQNGKSINLKQLQDWAAGEGRKADEQKAVSASAVGQAIIDQYNYYEATADAIEYIRSFQFNNNQQTIGDTLEASETGAFIEALAGLDNRQPDGINRPSTNNGIDEFFPADATSSKERQEAALFATIFRQTDGDSFVNQAYQETPGAQLGINNQIVNNNAFIVDSPQQPQATTTYNANSFGEVIIDNTQSPDMHNPTANEGNGYKDISIPLSSGVSIPENALIEVKIGDKVFSSSSGAVKLYTNVTPQLISFDPGNIEFTPTEATITITPQDGTASDAIALKGTTITAAERKIEASSDATNNGDAAASNTSTVAGSDDLSFVTDNDLKTYWGSADSAIAKGFQRLGIGTELINALNDDSVKTRFTEGLKAFKDLSDYIKKMATDKGATEPTPEQLSPDMLLKGGYRLTALAALEKMVGKTELEKNDSPIRTAVIQALTTQSTDGKIFLDSYLATGWGSDDNKTATEYLTDVNAGGPGAFARNIQDEKVQNALLTSAQNITGTDYKNKAKGWLALYGKGGLGNRSFAVIPKGNASMNGEASPSQNMPAFATRWLLGEMYEVTTVPTAKKLLKDKLSIDIDSNPLLAPLKTTIDSKLEELIKTGELQNLVAGILASSTKSVEAPNGNTRDITFTVDMEHLVGRLLGHLGGTQIPGLDKLVTQILGTDANNRSKEISLTMANVTWDQGNNGSESGTFQVFNELFNTKNNSNNTSAQASSTVIEEILKKPLLSSALNQAASTNSQVKVSNSTINGLSPDTYAEKGDLDEDKASLLIANWLKAKQVIFIKTSDARIKSKQLGLAQRLATGTYLTSVEEQLNSLNKTTTFNSQEIISVSNFQSTNDTTASAKFTITENTGSGASESSFIFTFTKTNDGWKISNRQDA